MESQEIYEGEFHVVEDNSAEVFSTIDVARKGSELLKQHMTLFRHKGSENFRYFAVQYNDKLPSTKELLAQEESDEWEINELNNNQFDLVLTCMNFANMHYSSDLNPYTLMIAYGLILEVDLRQGLFD